MSIRRLSLWVVMIALLVGFLYSLAGVLQATWLSATPDYPTERAERNFLIWGACVAVFLSLLLLLVIGFLVKTKHREVEKRGDREIPR